MQELIIEAGRTERHYWRDLLRYRELFYFLAWRDILVRYKQTVIGIAWALIRPFLTMLVFTFIFNRVARLHSPVSVPYPLMVIAAMLPWQFFATALTESSTSLISNANLISKVYFPRLIVPAGAVITSFVDFLITVALLAAMMVWYRFWPDWHILALPFFVALAFASSMGVGLDTLAFDVRPEEGEHGTVATWTRGSGRCPLFFSRSICLRPWALSPNKKALKFVILNREAGLLALKGDRKFAENELVVLRREWKRRQLTGAEPCSGPECFT